MCDNRHYWVSPAWPVEGALSCCSVQIRSCSMSCVLSVNTLLRLQRVSSTFCHHQSTKTDKKTVKYD